MKARGAVAKEEQRATRRKHRRGKGLAPENRNHGGSGRIPLGHRCRFCAGMSWCREREGCPLGPVGCGLPYAPERIR